MKLVKNNLLVLIALAFISASIATECGWAKYYYNHTIPKLSDEEVARFHQLSKKSEKTEKRTKNPRWMPIRIEVGLDNLAGAPISGSNKAKIISYSNAALEYYGKYLFVREESRPYHYYYKDKCFDSNIPSRYGMNSRNLQDKSLGMWDYDLHIAVNFWTEQNNVLARAGSCCQDQLTRKNWRPTFGMIEYNLHNVENGEFHHYVNVAIHELTHVLVMNGHLYQYFVDENEKQIGLNQVSMAEMSNGEKVWGLTTKRILREVRNFFNCQDIKSVHLENDDPYDHNDNNARPGHLEYSLFTQDVLGPITSDNHFQSFSQFGHALLEDSGWYQVDGKMIERNVYGRNKGCDFYYRKCMSKSVNREFCPKEKAVGCSMQQTHLGYCAEGHFLQRDKCMQWVPYSNGDCKDQHQVKFNEALFRVASPVSRCLIAHDFGKINGGYQPVPNVCVKTQCFRDKATRKLQIGFLTPSGEELVCKNENDAWNVDGYTGSIFCPRDFEEFCFNDLNQCPDRCSNQGFCRKSERRCKCYHGYFGENCNEDSACSLNCNEHGRCSSGKCVCSDDYSGKYCEIPPKPHCVNGEVVGNQCKCYIPFYGPTCELRTCPNDCSGKGTCNPYSGRCKCNDPQDMTRDCSHQYKTPEFSFDPNTFEFIVKTPRINKFDPKQGMQRRDRIVHHNDGSVTVRLGHRFRHRKSHRKQFIE